MCRSSRPGLTAIPSSPSIRFITMPAAGATRVSARKTSPLFSKRSTCVAPMSQ